MVGNSLGGCCVLRLAERADKELGGVVAVAPAGLDMGRWFFIIEGEGLLRSLLALPVPVPPWLIRRVVGQMYLILAFADPVAIQPGVVRAFTRHFGDRRTVSRYVATARELLPELRDPFRLASIRCPVLVVWGRQDRMVFPSGADRIQAEDRAVSARCRAMIMVSK